MPGDDTVMATPNAIQAAQTLKSVIANGLQDALRQLDNQAGDILSSPAEWSGRSAKHFRENVWPPVNTSLAQARQKLDELALQVDQVLGDVMAAGGNP